MKNNLIGISGKIGSGKDTLNIILQGLSEGATTEAIKYAIEESFDNPPPGAYENKKFADKLKDMVCLLLNCTREQLEDREFKEKELGEEWWYYKFDNIIYSISERQLFIRTVNSTVFSPLDEAEVDTYIIKLTPRKLLQLLGTECGREILHPNIWVNALFADYNDNDVNPIKVRQGRLTALEAFNLSQNNKPNWIITDVRFPNEVKAIKDRGGIVIRVDRPREIPTDDEGFVINLDIYKFGDKIIDYSNHPSETALDDYEFDYVIDNNSDIPSLIEKIKALNIV